MHEIIANDDLPRLGPYSPAVRVGDLVFVSAQAGVDPATREVPTGGFEAECRQALTNLAHVLAAAGADLTHVVKTTVFYTDVANPANHQQGLHRSFRRRPARTSRGHRRPRRRPADLHRCHRRTQLSHPLR